MSPVDVVAGDGPVILAAPHAGTYLPEDLLARLNPRGQELADTDWWIDRLYQDLLPGATRVTARFHRYVIDAAPGADVERLEQEISATLGDRVDDLRSVASARLRVGRLLSGASRTHAQGPPS